LVVGACHVRSAPTVASAADERNELAASQFIELHSIPSSQGRFAGYRIGRDQSADMRTIAAISRRTFSGSDRIESRPVVHEAALCAAFEHRLIEGVHVTTAMHEPNGGYRSGEIKQARPSIGGCEEARRVSTIGGHVFSPSGSKQHDY
jgi:hypothetical protein